MNYTKIPFRESDQKVFVADITKAKDILGWKPRLAEDSILEVARYVKNKKF